LKEAVEVELWLWKELLDVVDEEIAEEDFYGDAEPRLLVWSR
jgi:hypothetical protein